MTELIDSENVIAWLNAQIEKAQGGWLHDYGFPTNVIVALTDAKRFVNNLPTIEAEPVRRGRWIEVTKHRDENGTILTDFECSECCAMVKDSDAEEIESERFCYNCGADMREGGADNGRSD